MMTSLVTPPAPTPGDLDVRAAVARVRAAFATGRTRDLTWRRAQLAALDRLLTECEQQIVDAMTADLGRPPFETWLGEIASTKLEIAYARRHLGRWARPRRVGLPLPMLPATGHYRYVPLGTVLVIAPWNYPVYLTLGPLVGALAAGNTVVVKPSEHAPTVSALLAALLPTFLDPDAIAVVEGGADVTRSLLDEGLDLVFFTGSQTVAREVLRGAAEHLTPVVLELGGKCPAIVTADADLDVAARRIAWAKLLNSGQTCLAPDHVLVDRSVRDALVERLGAAITDMREGEDLGQRVVDGRHVDRLGRLLVGHGGTVALGGGIDRDARTVEPTVVVDPRPDAALMTEEIFGPVLPVVSFSRLEEAVQHVGRTGTPLAAYVFTSSRDTARRVVADVRCGGVAINHAILHGVAPQLPFGGVGSSGTGSYHGRWGFQTFSHRQSVLRKPTRPEVRLLYPPHDARIQRLLRRAT